MVTQLQILSAPRGSTEQSADEVAAHLVAQVADTNSQLHQGVVTNKMKRAETLGLLAVAVAGGSKPVAGRRRASPAASPAWRTV